MYENPTNANTLAIRRKWTEASTAFWRKKKKLKGTPLAAVCGEVAPDTSAPSVEQISRTSPGQEPPGKRKKKSKGVFAELRGNKTGNKPGKARLVRIIHDNEPSDRACLVRAIVALLKGASKEAFLADASEAIPSDRDPCPVNFASILADCGLALARASKDYFLPAEHLGGQTGLHRDKVDPG